LYIDNSSLADKSWGEGGSALRAIFNY